MKRRGFSIIELLVVVAIIAVVATIGFGAFGTIRAKARDAKRKFDIGQIGRFLFVSNCYVPSGGYGEYDLADLMAQLKASYPQAQSLPLPKDPKTGSDNKTNYIYQVAAADKCILYGNFENEDESLTLGELAAPEAGKGSGVLKATNPGPNGTRIYYQVGK